METIKQELQRAYTNAIDNYQAIIKGLNNVEVALHELTDVEFPYLLISAYGGVGSIVIRCQDPTDRNFLAHYKSVFEPLNFIFDEKPVKSSWTDGLSLTGHLYKDMDLKDELCTVTLHGPFTTKCLRVKQKIVKAAVEAKPEEIIYVNTVICPGQELSGDFEVLGTVDDE